MAECEKTTPVYNPSNGGEIIGWVTVEPDGEITCECAFTGMSWGFCETEEQAAYMLHKGTVMYDFPQVMRSPENSFSEEISQ